MYGIRRYLRGARMMLHVDKLPWNIIGAILHVNTYFKHLQNSNNPSTNWRSQNS